MKQQESDHAFIKRFLCILDAQADANKDIDPLEVTLDQEDVLRMIKLNADLPPNATRIN